MSDPVAATGAPQSGPPAGPRPKYKRKLSNYLLDKKLQLRYVLLVTILSGVIAGALGYLIYQQKRAASESIEKDLQALTQADASQEDFQEHVASGLESEDRALVYKMAGVGVGLVVILSLYLNKMRDGRLDKVWNLRKGDQLVDFYEHFKTAHAGVVELEKDDITQLKAVIAAAEAAGAGEHAAVVELRAILARKEKAIE